ncbi:hypothetical protein TEA_013219 [Camellia sinensis var. sinensis]|uniref:Uncharacterized protein n=1 Tax=Camellia sinensis var. sinensis TaxID=542762 RepID=A0A4S4E830_CAMSN|nr:hypothetical protein TEA_013219 [Camellia sinensis var. sinensis]
MLFLTGSYLEASCSTPGTVSNKKWAEETERKLQAWPRTAGPPVVMNPISRQNFIVKSREFSSLIVNNAVRGMERLFVPHSAIPSLLLFLFSLLLNVASQKQINKGEVNWLLLCSIPHEILKCKMSIVWFVHSNSNPMVKA